jgi:adenylate cyclase class 2
MPTAMQLEIEQKFRVADHAAAREKLLALGAEPGGTVEQRDEYLRHPARDFTQTGEALRLRSIDGEPFVTYKGPKLDATVKTRHELEFALGEAGEGLAELLKLLGFQSVAEVRKQRERFHLVRQGLSFEIALDTVDGLGRFVEVELVVDESGVELAQKAVVAIAAELGLSELESRSYLRMLLEQGQATEG